MIILIIIINSFNKRNLNILTNIIYDINIRYNF